MLTWMTRKSFLDTAADLASDLLVQSIEDSCRLTGGIMFDEVEEIAKIPANHPVTRMWIGYETALAAYCAALCVEAAARGIMMNHHLEVEQLITALRHTEPMEFVLPPWIEDVEVLRSHRSNLARRWPLDYGETWKGTPENWPYLWPFIDEDGSYKLFLSKQDKELLASGERTLPKPIQLKVANL